MRKYIIVEVNCRQKFQETIEEYFAEGYTLYGELKVTPRYDYRKRKDYNIYLQVMVK